MRGERQASERLLQLLHAAYGDDWHDGILTKLLAESGSASLDDWLRDQFFEEHCKLFQHRPFIWHIWDGRKRDGFHALVNYHKLAEGDGKGRRLLESLTYSYLGDWISRQQDGVKRGDGGAEDRLAAALELQKRLVAILGRRTAFRPFRSLEAHRGTVHRLGAGHQRRCATQYPPLHGPGSTRRQERRRHPARQAEHPLEERPRQGTDPRPGAIPWFWENGTFTGERVNDVHFTNAEKRAAQEAWRGTAATRK